MSKNKKKNIYDGANNRIGRLASYPLFVREEKITERINELATETISAPSKTSQKFSDLQKSAVEQ